MGTLAVRSELALWRRRAGALAVLLPSVGLGQSAPTTGVLQVTARVDTGCRVVGQQTQTNGLDFGVLDFGTYPSLFAVALTAQSQGPAGVLQLTCNGVTTANVSIGTGLYASGNQRRMASGANRVAYDLYADSGMSLPFSGAAPRAITISPGGGTATIDLPIYGRVAPSPDGYAAGGYQDDVQITISW